MKKFEGKVALVTGAAHGIGKQIAVQFAQEGANTVIVDYNPETGTKTAEEITNEYQKSLFVQADVSNPDALMNVREKVFGEFGRIDILVLNAGVAFKNKMNEISFEEWNKTLAINQTGLFNTVKAFYNDFLTNNGAIAYIRSGSALSGTGGGVSWTVPFAVLVIPALVILNLIMVRFKITKVLNVDIWNFMHFLVPGALAYALFGSAVIGFLVAVACGVAALFFSQWLAPKWGEFFGLEGTTCTTLAFCAWVYPITYGINWIIDRIPGLNKIDVDMDKIGEKLGILGDPGCITCTGIMIPITIALAFLVPDMRFFPLGILAEVCYLAPMCVLTSKGNVFRTLVCMIIMMYATLFFANMFAPEATQMMSVTGVKFDSMVTASHFGWNPGNLIVSMIHKVFVH